MLENPFKGWDSGKDPAEAGVTDHGELSGLGDNDHPQYLLAADLLNKTYPIGSVYISVSATSPATLFGGTWVAFGAGRVLVGRDASDPDFDTAEETGGEKTHTLTIAEMPSHTHIQDAHGHVASTGSAGAHTHSLRMHSTVSGSYPYVKGEMNPGNWYGNNVSTAGAHTHTVTVNNTTATNQNTGGGSAHNNLQPYITVYMWKRTG
jgi:microcystin-dependent protein